MKKQPAIYTVYLLGNEVAETTRKREAIAIARRFVREGKKAVRILRFEDSDSEEIRF